MPKIFPLPYKKLVRIFELDGFKISRTKGDHLVMSKQGVIRPLVIKMSDKEVSVTHIRTNMTTAQMSRERFFELLEKIN